MVNTLEHKVSNRVAITIGHSENKKVEINSIFDQFGKSVDGLGHLMHRANIFRLYRCPDYI